MRQDQRNDQSHRAAGHPAPLSISHALWRGKWLIVIPTVLAAILSFLFVSMLKPVYRSEARLMIENIESPYTRAGNPREPGPAERMALDPEVVASQVQVITSRDIAKVVTARLDLASRPEFNAQLQPLNPLKMALVSFGLLDNPLAGTAEDRAMRAYYERLTAYAVDKSRILVVQFDSETPQLAADAANSVTDSYLAAQQRMKQGSTQQASEWLNEEIGKLRRSVADADAAVENFRSGAGLFVGANNTTLTQQQLAEVNTQINNARAQSIDGQTRARMLRDLLRSGKPLEAADITQSDAMRRLSDQRAASRAMLAEQSATLGPRHPRIIELKAQLSDIELQMRAEAEKVIRSLDNDVRIAGARLETLGQTLDQVKKQAGTANEQDVKLRALEREAKTKREQLEMMLARAQDAAARSSSAVMPADARVISRAQPANLPHSPKKLAMIAIATLGTLALCLGGVLTGALFRSSGQSAPQMVAYVPAGLAPPVRDLDEPLGPPARRAPAPSAVPEPEPAPEPEPVPVRIPRPVPVMAETPPRAAPPPMAPVAEMDPPRMRQGFMPANHIPEAPLAPAPENGARLPPAAAPPLPPVAAPLPPAAAPLPPAAAPVPPETVQPLAEQPESLTSWLSEVRRAAQGGTPAAVNDAPAISPDMQPQSFAQGGAETGDDVTHGLGMLRRRIEMMNGHVQTLCVVPASDGMGAAVSAMGLARDWALAGRRVAVLDLAASRPSIHMIAGGRAAPGMSDVLAGKIAVSDVLYRDHASYVSLAPFGSSLMNQREVLSHDKLALFIDGLAEAFDHILLVTGPIVSPVLVRHLKALCQHAIVVSGGDEHDPAVMAAYDGMVTVGLPATVLVMA